MINTLPVTGAARAPRALVRINGQVLPWTEWEVNNNGYYQADTFHVTLALYALPASYDWTWFSSQTAFKVEVLAGFPADPERFAADELDLIILGTADDMAVDPAAGTIGLSGRDLTSLFVDSKTSQKWPNQRSSDIATALAKKHGLTPKVTKTSKKVGTYYTMDHVHVQADQSEWDLLTYLAQKEGFSVYVKGRDLHFEPATSPSSDPYVLEWTPPTGHDGARYFNGMRLGLSRNLTLAKDIVVKVHSWSALQMTGFTKTATASHTAKTKLSGLPQPVGNAQVYSYTIPGLTPEQALDKAQSLLKELSAHELRLEATLPGDNLLTPRTMLQLKGTGTDFDQRYYVNQVLRHMDLEDGYTMQVSAKNHPTHSMVTL